MKKLLLSFSICFFFTFAFSQEKNLLKPTSLGISLFFNDFKTPSLISNSTLSSVLVNKDFGRLVSMSPGLTVSYIKGVCNNLDFAGSLAGSFLDYTNADGKLLGTSSFLLELDASLHAKMLPDNYYVVPYLSAGVGLSKYKGYYGAIMPLGAGFQIKITKEAFLVIDSQYRVKVSENTANHFMHSIGIVGSLEGL